MLIHDEITYDEILQRLNAINQNRADIRLELLIKLLGDVVTHLKERGSINTSKTEQRATNVAAPSEEWR